MTPCTIRFTGAAIGDPTFGWDDHRNKTSEVIYPDSTSGTDRVKHRYNRQGELIETTDQNQTERAFDYDLLGRRTQDRVVTLGSGVDGAVRRIETAYNKQGEVERITSFDSARRKAWLFVDNVESGERSAMLMSIVSSARRHDLDVWVYLNDVLEQVLAGRTDYLIHTCYFAKADPIGYLTALQRNASQVQEDPSQWLPWNCRERLPAK